MKSYVSINKAIEPKWYHSKQFDAFRKYSKLVMKQYKNTPLTNGLSGFDSRPAHHTLGPTAY